MAITAGPSEASGSVGSVRRRPLRARAESGAPRCWQQRRALDTRGGVWRPQSPLTERDPRDRDGRHARRQQLGPHSGWRPPPGTPLPPSRNAELSMPEGNGVSDGIRLASRGILCPEAVAAGAGFRLWEDGLNTYPRRHPHYVRSRSTALSCGQHMAKACPTNWAAGPGQSRCHPCLQWVRRQA